MGPQNQRLRIVTEQAFDGVGIRMRVQHEAMSLRKLDDTAHDRQIGIGATHMELPDGD